MRAALAFLSVLLACRPAPPPAPPEARAVAVTCERARVGVVEDLVSLRGVVTPRPSHHAVVSPMVAGRLLEVTVREGEQVEAGAVLAVVESPSLQGALSEAEAAVDGAQANATATRVAAVRARRLFDAGVSARREAEDAEAKAAAATADLQAARARREVAAQQLDLARVRAPIAGTVIHRLREPGELVDGTPGTPVVELADPRALELLATAPAADLARLKGDEDARVTLEALPGHAVDGRVVALSQAVDPATSLGAVRVELPEEAAAHARIGFAGTARITIARRDTALLVPARAVHRGPGGTDQVVVCELRDDGRGTARVRAVRLGARAGDEVEVLEGVEPGERVATSHLLGLEPDAPIRAAEARP